MNFKKSLSILLTLCMLLLCAPHTLAVPREGEGNVHFYGDVNFDDKLNTADATLQLKFSASMIVFTAEKELALTGDGYMKADANKDSFVNTLDATTILKVSANMINPNTYTGEATEYTVKYSSGSLSESAVTLPADKVVNVGETFTIMDVAVAQGHEFLGWASDYDGNMYTIGGSFVMPKRDVTLTALWDNEQAPTPTPTPSGEPTPTQAPTPTSEPTPTGEPTPTQQPTPTPTATPTPTPTPTPDSIEIATKGEFLKIGVDPAYGMNKKYVVTADIDFGGEVLYPRGYANGKVTNFTGKFDGQGHKFTNFSFAYLPDYEGSGLFYVNNGIITNLCVDCSPCTITVASSGMICYENSGSGQIRGCGTSGKMVYKAGNSWLAGIASSNMATIDQCWTNVEIEACTELIDNAEGYVDAGYSGMITAYAYGGTISNCITFGSISGSYVGVIFGQNSAGMATGIVTNCYSLTKIDFYHPEMYFNEIGFTPVVNYQTYYPNCTGFFYLQGQTYMEGELYTNKDNNQHTDSYYGCALDPAGFNPTIMNMYDASIWDFSGTYPVLRNCAGMADVTVAPYAG